MRDGLSRGLLETIFALTGVVLVVLDTILPNIDNGFGAGMALITASGASFGLRYTKPSARPDDPEPPA